MTLENNEYEQFNKLLENLLASGIEKEEALKFIEENIDTLSCEGRDVNDNIYFILNNEDIYAIIYVIEDDYYWSTLIDGRLTSLKTLDKDECVNIDNADYIVEMIIDFANNEKIKKVLPEIASCNLEDKLRLLRKIELNSNGYHIK